MKSFPGSLLAVLAICGCVAAASRADDRVSGFRYVDEPADIAKGEVQRTKSYNLKGEMIGLKVTYKNGQVRNEKYDKGVLRIIHETDFKGWSRDAEFNATGVLLTETEHRATGQSVVFVNVDAIDKNTAKDVHVAVGDEVHLVSTTEPWPGSRSDKVAVTKTGVINTLTTTPTSPQNAKLLQNGSFVAFAKGDTDVKTTTTTVTPGFPGPLGRPPQTTSKDSLVKVHVK